MSRKVIRVMMGLFAVVVFGITGCGGGDSSGDIAPASTPVQKTSIVDGVWDVTTSTAPYLSKQTESAYLTYSYFGIEFKNGEIDFNERIWPWSHSKSGTFSVTDNILTYNFISATSSTAHLSTEPGGALDYFNRTINETAAVNITISGNTMTWKDNTGSIVATLTKR